MYRERMLVDITHMTDRAIADTFATLGPDAPVIASHMACRFGKLAYNLTDDIIRLRYVEIDGQLRKMLVVVKMRGGDHSKDICEYQITSGGFRLGNRLRGYQALTTGVPKLINPGVLGSEQPSGRPDREP